MEKGKLRSRGLSSVKLEERHALCGEAVRL